MEDKDKIIDQSVLANDVSSKIQYEFLDMFLVKGLDPVKVKKEFSKPVASNSTPSKDKHGIEAIDYDKVETEVKEVNSDYRRGIVLKVPMSYTKAANNPEISVYTPEIKIGDIVIFRDTAGYFDLVKDSRLIRQWEIIAIEQ